MASRAPGSRAAPAPNSAAGPFDKFQPHVARAGQARAIGIGRAEALLVRHRLGREEAEHGFAAKDFLAADRAAHRELLDDQIADPVGREQLDRGGDSAVMRADLAMLDGVAVEVAEQEVARAAIALQRVGSEPAARLQRHLHQHAIGHGGRGILGEVPGIGRHVVESGDLRARLHRPHLALQRDDAGHEVVRRPRQALGARAGIERREALPERSRRLPERARHQRGMIEREAADMRQRPVVGPRIDQLAIDPFAHAGERPVGHQLEPEPLAQEGLAAVDRAKHMREQGRPLARDEFVDEDLVGDAPRLRRHLAPAEKAVARVAHRLEAPAVAWQRHAGRRHVEAHRLQAGIGHQRARHAGIAFEMAVEEPLVSRDRRVDAQVAAPGRTAREIEPGDRAEEVALVGGRGRRAGMRVRQREPIAEAGDEIAVEPGLHLGGRETAPGGRGGGPVDGSAVAIGCGRGVPDHAGRIRQLLAREEARLPVAHRDAHRAVDPAIIVEEEQPHVALPGMAVDRDLVIERVAGPGQVAMEGQLAAEQAIGALAPVERVDAEPRDQQQVRLPAFDEDAGRHAAVVEIPAVGGGHPSASRSGRGPCCARRPRSPARDRTAGAVARHADLDGIVVLLREARTEDGGDTARPPVSRAGGGRIGGPGNPPAASGAGGSRQQHGPRLGETGEQALAGAEIGVHRRALRIEVEAVRLGEAGLRDDEMAVVASPQCRHPDRSLAQRGVAEGPLLLRDRQNRSLGCGARSLPRAKSRGAPPLGMTGKRSHAMAPRLEGGRAWCRRSRWAPAQAALECAGRHRASAIQAPACAVRSGSADRPAQPPPIRPSPAPAPRRRSPRRRTTGGRRPPCLHVARHAGTIEGQRQMFACAQYLADRGGEAAARAMLDEEAHPVRPCLFDDAGEIECLQRLAA